MEEREERREEIRGIEKERRGIEGKRIEKEREGGDILGEEPWTMRIFSSKVMFASNARALSCGVAWTF
jgi:hypothetical protein